MKKIISISLILACAMTSACSLNIKSDKVTGDHSGGGKKGSKSTKQVEEVEDTTTDDVDFTEDITETTAKMSASSFDLAGTEWTTDDYSYMTISDSYKFHWFQSQDNLDDNYYAGDLTVYIGEDAFDYLTVDLYEYGIEAYELESLFGNDNLYSMDNLVCFHIEYDSYVISGEEQIDSVAKTDGYWYGFILEDGDFLDLANMDTGTYYGFVKIG